MNLPESVDDPSLLQHEPLLSHCAMLWDASRSETRRVSLSFVRAMQIDPQAQVAVKRWASLLFRDYLAEEVSLEVMDGGQELYSVFFEYMRRLRDPKTCKPSEYLTQILKKGPWVLKLQNRGAHATRHHSQRSDNGAPRRDRVKHDTGNNVSSENVDQSVTDVVAINPENPRSTLPSGNPMVPQEFAAQSRQSKFKKGRKRKASSQKPPVITPSDAFEVDAEPSERHMTSLEPPATSVSHRPKFQSTFPSFRPSCSTVPHNSRGKRINKLAPGGQKHERSVINAYTEISKPSSRLGILHKAKVDNTDLPARASKRSRQASMPPNLHDAAGPGFNPITDIRKDDSRELRIPEHMSSCPPIIQQGDGTAATRSPFSSSVSALLSTRDLSGERPKSCKRPRHAFEAGSMEPQVNPPSDANKSLGLFDVRDLRPLPPNVRATRTPMQSVNTGPGGCGPRYAVQSQDDVDRLLRDVATNAFVVLRDENRPDVPDWIQDEDHNAEINDYGAHDTDEANDMPTAASSSPLAVAHKPPVPASPLIWAQSRQEVCESFEHFRSYHSGVYSNKDVVKGYLLGAYAASRDLFYHGGKLIISHGGGKSESTLESRIRPRRHQAAQDQEASDKSVRALLKTYKECRPLVLLADDKYALFPYDLAASKYTYVVLGMYWISRAWAECQPTSDGLKRIVRWKFAFQWCEGQADPWWMTQKKMKLQSSDLGGPPTTVCFPLASVEEPPRLSDPEQDPSVQCGHCREKSPTVYMQGWMCLNPHCNVFWSINGKEPQELGYCEEFLKLVPQKFRNLPNIMPARAVQTPDRITTTYSFSKGWHCTNCGRLSCRFKWEHWECSNCHARHAVEGRVRLAKEFWHQRPASEFLHSQIGKNSGVLARLPEPINLGAARGFTNRLTFILPHGRGKIHLILGTPLANVDADVTFQMYQRQASTSELKLRRYPLRNHRARGLLLTNYFSQNSGKSYQYVGGTGNTIPFDEAPDCVRRALALIKERSRLALGADIPFNEILSAAYMERQKMSFHSDSEKGLGPIVASLSLGSAALMHFRPHVNAQNQKYQCTTALTLVLRHGDVLIMEGDGVQEYYEHTVVPMNFRIAATARCIGST
ncbi:hypothetical protein BS17DRAFT_775348 [Gyrodon lividus]|nr:hypothetical protein BS17DRAFT_775348 [Gyrodon lividus]